MYRMMIVEDELIIRNGLVHDIDWTSLGFEISQEACNGKDALRKLGAEQPHAILTDIRMPIMDGLKLMTEVNSRYSQIRLVVISGYDNFEYARHAMSCGAVGYIMKPTNDDEIRQTFTRLRLLLDAAAADCAPVSTPAFAAKEEDNPLISQIKACIAAQYQERITLASVAEEVHMNTSYLSTYFKKYTGTGFHEYLTQVRMIKAKELLLYTEHKIYSIAAMVGYDDCRHFNRIYKAVHGLCASQTRKNRISR